MLRSEAVARIKEGLGFRDDLDDTIVARLKESQRLIEKGRSLPFFLVEESATLAVPSGSADVALPTGFIREKGREGLNYYSSIEFKNNFLEKLNFNVGVARFVNVSAGVPRAYALRKATLKFWPNRDAAYNLTWSYFKAGDVLSTDIENVWLANAPNILIGHAGASLAKDLRDESAVSVFNAMYVEAWNGAFAEGIMRDEENAPLYVGGRL